MQSFFKNNKKITIFPLLQVTITRYFLESVTNYFLPQITAIVTNLLKIHLKYHKNNCLMAFIVNDTPE